MELIYLDKVDKTDKLMNEELISNYLIYNLKNLSIYNNTEIYGKNINDTTIDKIMENVKSIISHIYPNEIIKEIKDGNDLMVFENNEIIINITSTENQKLNKNKNISTINLGICENKLKKEYNISNNESLLIYKIDILKKGMKIPRIEYEVYYPLHGNKLEKLNLTICKGLEIDINIPIIINNIDKYNLSSNYYNDVCYKSKSVSGSDITLNDRKNEYIEKYLYACEDNCKFKEFKKDTNKALCSCNVKTNLNLFLEISKNKNLLLKSFNNIKNIINLNIMKCYYTLFTINGISKNISSYILLSIILFYFICIIIFYKKIIIKL